MRTTYMDTLLQDDIENVSSATLPWEKLGGSPLMITGASGLIGSFLVAVIMYKNRTEKLGCKIYAIARDIKKAKEKFSQYSDDELVHFIQHDINRPLELPRLRTLGYLLHLASNTHPVAYATDPIGTITANVIGTNNMLGFAAKHGAKRFLFASSNEIYGENRGDQEFFDKHYCGYIDCNTLRAGYPESKRCGEALCQAYIKQKGLDAVIARLTRTYGPTMLMSDTKAISQFIKNGIAHEDVVLKSAGTQFYSYTYVADAVSGLLTVLLLGKCGEAYNIADESGDITLKDLAAVIANNAGTRVIFENPSDTEKAGYSTATKARLDGRKIKALGWRAEYDIQTGLQKTIEILQSTKVR